MKARYRIVGGLLLAALVLAGGDPAGARPAPKKKKPKPAAKAKVYRTPEQVFDAFHASLRKGDFRTHVDCMSRELVKQQAASVALARVLERRAAQSDAERLKSLQPVFDTLDAHGLTTQAVKDLNGDSDERDVLALIEFPGAFLVAVLAAARKADPPKERLGSDPPRLTNVQINQDRARGASVENRSGREIIGVVEFVKVGDSWKMAPAPAKAKKDP